MRRRQAPKACDHFSEEAALGRRRQNVHIESSRQRDSNLRARRLQAELSGSASGELTEMALASLGPDVLADATKKLAAALQSASPVELPAQLQQLAKLLLTGLYQTVQAAVEGQVVPRLADILQHRDAQLPPEVVRTTAYVLELIASDSVTAARAVLPAAPALTSQLAAAVARLGPETNAASSAAEAAAAATAADARDATLLEAAQLAGPLGAMAGWGYELQRALTEVGVGPVLLLLLLATIDCAAERVSPAVDAAAQLAAGNAPPLQGQLAALQPGPEPPDVQCCSTALWALGMMLRDRGDASQVTALAVEPALLAGLRRVLLSPMPYPELLRSVAWVVAFCSSCGGPEATETLVDRGGLLPGLLLSTIRFAHYAAPLTGDDPDLQAATQPLHSTLVPLLLAAANIADDPKYALLVLTELQAARPLQPGVTATAMKMLLACLQGSIPHRRVHASAAGLVAALARGARKAGPVAVDAVRNALMAAGVTPVLVELLRGSIMDVRREAAAALGLLTEGATIGNDPRPGRLAMLRTLGVTGKADQQGVLASFLELLRSCVADAVDAALGFVTVVLRELRGGKRLVEELDGIDALEAVQEGRSGLDAPALQAWAQQLVDKYYGVDCEDEDEEEDGEDSDNALQEM